MANVANGTITHITGTELLVRHFPERTYLLSPWLRTGETAMVWAASGVGKTMLSLSIALAVAGGGKLAGWSAPEARRVLYIDGEMNLQDMRDRVVLLLDGGAIEGIDRELALSNLKIIARQDQEVGTSFYDVTDTQDQDAILRRVKRENVGLVILDNFTTLSGGLDDENSATAFKEVHELFMQLKRLRVGPILVHHSNKSGKDYRGSTALEATFEVIIGLERPKVYAHGQTKFDLKFRKYRSKGDDSLETAMWTLVDGCWELESSLTDDPKDDPIYAAIMSRKYESYTAIGKAMNRDKSTISRRAGDLIAYGLLSKAEVVECFATAKRRNSAANDDWEPSREDLEREEVW